MDTTKDQQNDEGPAYRLVGRELQGGWKVTARHERVDGATGGKYSVGYDVERNGQKGFLKALDFSRAKNAPDLPAALQALTQAFLFERRLLEACAARRMDRVIAPIDNGEVLVDDSVLGRVSYIIFESADRDIRAQLAEAAARFDVTCKLRALHHIATGLHQLHGEGIAHQDVKPSNVLQFGPISKVADLGCASQRGAVGPMDNEACAGTRSYAPPELRYDYILPDFNVRRFGCDAYLLGSMVVFFFSALSMSASIFANLHPDHRPGAWGSDYPSVLPYVREAFGTAVDSFGTHVEGPVLRRHLVRIVRELCDPDPALRGHPANRIGHMNRLSLERYVGELSTLALRSHIGVLERYS